MIGLSVVAVGKIKDAWLRDGCAEYCKRLGLWGGVNVFEVDECRLGENPSPAQIADCIEKEGVRILAKIPKGALVVALCIEGQTLSSEQLAEFFALSAVRGARALCFVIGGSYGLSERVKNTAALRLSMSPMTFPHQLARVLLLEQLYRAASINGNGKYHK